jgi:hypothetical protein
MMAFLDVIQDVPWDLPHCRDLSSPPQGACEQAIAMLEDETTRRIWNEFFLT